MGKYLRFNLILLAHFLALWNADAYTSLTDAYAALGFDPAAPGNAVVVYASDQHMCLTCQLPTTNFYWLFIKDVNEMNPPPAKMVIAGDTSTTFSEVPGQDALKNPSAYSFATNEMAYFSAGLLAFTNIAQSNIVWIPGNHDQSPTEDDAATFRMMYPNMPIHQTFDISGLRFILVNSGNYDELSDSEHVWFEQQVANTSPTQEVAVVTHQQPFPGAAFQRGAAAVLADLFHDWKSRWWVFCGHGHAYGLDVFNVGRSNVTQIAVGAASTNTFVGFSQDVGCMFLCLSNGLKGIVYHRFRPDRFDLVPEPDWDHPKAYVPPFSEADGLLWRRLKTHVLYPELIVTNVPTDSYDWFAYPRELQWSLALGLHGNLATDFLLLCGYFDNTVHVSFSADRTNWISVPFPSPTNAIYSFSIPESLRGLPIAYARLLASENSDNFLAGWGLSTTNRGALVTYPQFTQTENQQAFPGELLQVTNMVVDPYAPPDILTFSLLSGPEGASLDPRTGVLSWQPADSHPYGPSLVSMKVADNEPVPQMTSTQEFTINVVPPPQTLLSSPTFQSGGIQFSVAGRSHRAYTILTSTNLKDWTALLETNTDVIPFLVRDLVATNGPARFYRAEVDPWPEFYDSDAVAFFSRAGLTNEAEMQAVQQLVLDAKAHGWWTNCDVIYPFVGGTALSDSQNLKSSSYSIRWSGGITHNSMGVTGNGVNGYGSTDFNFKANGVAYTTNSAHLFFYGGTVAPINEGVFLGGYRYVGTAARMFLRRTSSVLSMSGVNNNDDSNLAASPGGDFRGPMIGTRTGPTSEALGLRDEFWANGPQTPSIEPPNAVCGILARIDQDGAAIQFSDANLRGASIGGGLTQAQWEVFLTDWNNFEERLGRKAP